jgi:REP element-mobilizing transposase RayT
MPSDPLAYHITIGTYGTRLHGDERGTIDRHHNTPGEPVLGHNERWKSAAQKRLKYPPVVLSLEQQRFVESILPHICERGDWDFHIAACQPDHVHVLLASDTHGNAVRRWLKTWLSEALSKQWPEENCRAWWAEGGSVRWIWEQDHLVRVYDYVHKQRTIAR